VILRAEGLGLELALQVAEHKPSTKLKLLQLSLSISWLVAFFFSLLDLCDAREKLRKN
jgi:hypothetical protein